MAKRKTMKIIYRQSKNKKYFAELLKKKVTGLWGPEFLFVCVKHFLHVNSFQKKKKNHTLISVIFFTFWLSQLKCNSDESYRPQLVQSVAAKDFFSPNHNNR